MILYAVSLDTGRFQPFLVTVYANSPRAARDKVMDAMRRASQHPANAGRPFGAALPKDGWVPAMGQEVDAHVVRGTFTDLSERMGSALCLAHSVAA